jgi:hypothetical protein
LVETFHGTVGLRMPDLDSCVLDLVEMEKELIGMVFLPTAVLHPLSLSI